MKISIIINTILALVFLASNSILCKLAFQNNGISAFSFTSIRLASGALMLFILVKVLSNKKQKYNNNFLSGFMLFVYAISFSYAYLLLDTGVGALILFGTVQIVMICFAYYQNEHISIFKIIGCLISFGGLLYLLLPNDESTITFDGAFLMLISGIAWAIYSIVGKSTNNPLLITSSNFSISLIFIVIVSSFLFSNESIQTSSFIYAFLSGAITSGIGYILWYSVISKIETSTASIVQLCVPLIATFGGVLLLNEALTTHLIVSTIIILTGITLSIIQFKTIIKI